MKNKRIETDKNKNSPQGKFKKNKEKINKKVKMKLDEDEKVNSYEEYRIEKIDLISESSEEDIETKMKKLIEIKKKGGNLDDYNKNEMNKIQFKKIVLNENKEQKNKNEEKFNKIKNGLDIFTKFYLLKKINIKKNIFKDIIFYSNKIKEKKQKEEEEKQIKEEIIKNNIPKKNIYNLKSTEESKNFEINTNLIIDKNSNAELKIIKLINSINKILLTEKGKFFYNIIRTRKKRRTIRMGSNVSKRSFGHDYRKKTRKQTMLAHQKSKDVINEVEEEEISFDLDDPKFDDPFIQMHPLEDIAKDIVNKSQ